MRNVSEAYRAAMAKPIRDQGHARVDLFIGETDYTNTTQTVSAGWDSNVVPLGEVSTHSYAALDLFKVDGSQILPNESGRVSANKPEYVSDYSTNDIDITINITDVSEEGEARTTIRFDKLFLVFDSLVTSSYAVRCRVYMGSDYDYIDASRKLDGSTMVCYRSNGSPFSGVTKINIIIRRYEEEPDYLKRIRLKGIVLAGYYRHFENDGIADITWKEHADPTAKDFPQIDATLNLLDSADEFDPEEENGILDTALESGRVTLDFGITLADSTVEWLSMMNGKISEMTATKDGLTVQCTDYFRVSDGEVYMDSRGENVQPEGHMSGGIVSASVPVFSPYDLNFLCGYALAKMGRLQYAEDGATSTDANYALFDDISVPVAFMKESAKSVLQIAANKAKGMLKINSDGHLQAFAADTSDIVKTLTKDEILENGTVTKLERVKSLATSFFNYNAIDETEYSSGVITGYSSAYVLTEFSRLGLSWNYENDPIGAVKVSMYYYLDSNQTIKEGETLDSVPSGAHLYGTGEYDVMNGHITDVQISADIYSVKLDLIYDSSPSGSPYIFFIFKVQTKPLKNNEYSVVKTLNSMGREDSWKNPIIHTADEASALAEWLSDFDAHRLEYEYDYRGSLELEAGDVITQESPLGGETSKKVIITDAEINFNGAFTGHLKTKVVD